MWKKNSTVNELICLLSWVDHESPVVGAITKFNYKEEKIDWEKKTKIYSNNYVYIIIINNNYECIMYHCFFILNKIE